MELLVELENYKKQLEIILASFTKDYKGIHFDYDYYSDYCRIIQELSDLLEDNNYSEYSMRIYGHYQQGKDNFLGSPTFESIEQILSQLGALITRLKKNHEKKNINKNEKLKDEEIFMLVLERYYEHRKSSISLLQPEDFGHNLTQIDLNYAHKYLLENELINCVAQPDAGGYYYYFNGSITAKGIDYLHQLKKEKEMSNYSGTVNPFSQNPSNSQQSQSKGDVRIFISHSEDDEELAEKIVDLITGTTDLKRKNIRCTSVDGCKVKIGSDTPNVLKSELESCDIILGLITSNSIDSNWVLFELGVGWFLGKAWTIVADELDFDSIPKPLRGRSALKINEEDRLVELIEQIAEKTNLEKESHVTINKKVRQFLNDL